jgi:hypothetical protein
MMRHGTMGLVALLLVIGCGDRRTTGTAVGGTDSSVALSTVEGALRDIDKQEARDAANPYADRDEPCALIAPADVEPLIGSLRAPPWRSGSSCHYAAADGQRIEVSVYYSGAMMQANVMNAVNREISKGLIIKSGRGLDTLEGRWDEAHWRLGDYLESRRGDVGVTVMLGNTLRPDPAAAAQLADMAFGRLDQPLAYESGAASEPPPLVAGSDACALLTREEVAAATGATVGEPAPGGGGKSTWCSWPLTGAKRGQREFTLAATWREGFAELNSHASAFGLYQTNLEEPELARIPRDPAVKDPDAAMKEMMRDSVGARMIGAVRGMMQGNGAELRDGSLSLRSDGDVKGPWRRGVLLAGSDFYVVTKDVCLRIGLGGVGFEQAKGLMAKAVARL